MPTATDIPVSHLVHSGILEITISEDPSEIARSAQTTLARYLPLAPQVNWFRVNWHFFGPGYMNEGTALYDRKLKTLRSYSHTGCNGEGCDGSDSLRRHIQFHVVTDAILIKMAHKDSQTESGAALGFLHLKDYGCKVTKLK